MSVATHKSSGNGSEVVDKKNIALQDHIRVSEQNRIKAALFNIVHPTEFWHTVGLNEVDLEDAVYTVEWTSSNYLNWTFEIRTLCDHLIIYYDGYNGLDSEGNEWKIEKVSYDV